MDKGVFLKEKNEIKENNFTKNETKRCNKF